MKHSGGKAGEYRRHDGSSPLMDDPENGHRSGQEGAKEYQRLNIAGHLVKQNLAASVSAHSILLRQNRQAS
jgi:hypothetical protein